MCVVIKANKVLHVRDVVWSCCCCCCCCCCCATPCIVNVGGGGGGGGEGVCRGEVRGSVEIQVDPKIYV